MLTKLLQLNRAANHKTIYHCIFSKPNTALTPEKHIYMTHNFHNSYPTNYMR